MNSLRFRVLATWVFAAIAARAQISCNEATCTGVPATLTGGSGLATTTSPGLGLTAAPTVVSGCPAAVSTTDICSTCVTADCVIEATVTVACGCPNPPLTIFSSHPCSLGCGGLGCGTVYKVITAACTGDSGPGTTGSLPTNGIGGTGSAGATGAVHTGAACRVAPFRFW